MIKFSRGKGHVSQDRVKKYWQKHFFGKPGNKVFLGKNKALIIDGKRFTFQKWRGVFDYLKQAKEKTNATI